MSFKLHSDADLSYNSELKMIISAAKHSKIVNRDSFWHVDYLGVELNMTHLLNLHSSLIIQVYVCT